MPDRSIEFESERQFHKLYGEDPENLLAAEKTLGVKIVARGNLLHMQGDTTNLDRCEKFFSQLESAKGQGFIHGKLDFLRFLEKVNTGKSKELEDLLAKPLRLKIRKKSVVPRNLGQRRFLDLILKNDMVFGIGPAGTGKTFLAMIAALHALLEGEIERIVLTLDQQ